MSTTTETPEKKGPSNEEINARQLEEIDTHHEWYMTLNEVNIERIAAKMRELLEGKLFAIASCQYCERPDPRFEVRPNCKLNSGWTDGQKIMIRVFPKGQRDITDQKVRDWSSFGFSAGGFYWSWIAAPGGQLHDEDHRWPEFHFKNGVMYVIQRAPAGCLHKHAFAPQRSLQKDDTGDH